MSNLDKYKNLSREQAQEETETIDGACNPVALMNSMILIIKEIRESEDFEDQMYSGRPMGHPVIRYFLQKLCDMSMIYLDQDYGKIYGKFMEYSTVKDNEVSNA